MQHEELEIPAFLDRRLEKPSPKEPDRSASVDPGGTLPIDTIQVGERHRRDMGDLDVLAESIADVGLLHPIVVTPDGRLIAGARRLDAVRKLGWSQVPVTRVPLALEDIPRGESAENALRKALLPSEIDAVRRELEPQARALARERQSRKVAGTGEEARDTVAKLVGVSRKTLDKIAAVLDAAEAEPEKYGSLVGEMDRTGKVDGAHRKLQQARKSQTEISSSPDKVAKRRSRLIERAVKSLAEVEIPSDIAAAELTGVDRDQLIASLEAACPWLNRLLEALTGGEGHDTAAPGRTGPRPNRSTARKAIGAAARAHAPARRQFDDDPYGEMADTVPPKQLGEELQSHPPTRPSRGGSTD